MRDQEILKEKDVTSESIYLNRRSILKAMGFGLVAGASSLSRLLEAHAAEKLDGRPVTSEKVITTYNNFYEFSLDKSEVHENVGKFKITPWEIEVAGLIRNPMKLDLSNLIKKVKIEERIYRFRCVEAWSMVIPWQGFALADLVKLADPKPEAKFIKFTSFYDESATPNFKALATYPWPYTEGLTIEEARHPLALLATGLYGKPLPKQNGAPIRLVVPWKYGFKGIKSIRKIEFVSQQPVGLWEKLAPSEYGFYANVNPEVPHPRWSQATERVVDGSLFTKKIPTLKFNGYEKEVASLYKGLDLKKYF